MLDKLFNKYQALFDINKLPYQGFNPCGLCDKTCSIERNIDTKEETIVYTIHRNFGSWEQQDSTLMKCILCNWNSFITFILIAIIILIVLVILAFNLV